MLASADSDAAPHPADCAPVPRRPVAPRQGHSHRVSVALQPEVTPDQAHAVGSGVAPSRVGSYAHPCAWGCGQRLFRVARAPGRPPAPPVHDQGVQALHELSLDEKTESTTLRTHMTRTHYEDDR